MEKEKLENELQEIIQNMKTKTITIAEIYEKLKLPYQPNSDKMLAQVLLKLIEQNKIQPIKSSGKNVQGIYTKYKIVTILEPEKKQIQNEILKLHSKININYYLKHTNEYKKDKLIVEKINQFLLQPSTQKITVNERSYQLLKDEKKLKQNEEILKKLGITYEDLYAYETYEPFFYYINEKWESTQNNKRIFIIENKDTFWTMKKIVQNCNRLSDVYMVIYGEGKKILKSFSFIKNFQITPKDTILYFGDIDYEGINIYIALKEKYNIYNIQAYKKAYETILDIEQNSPNMKTKQNENQEYIYKFLNEFDDKYKQKLKKILDEKKYIPQEVFNYEIAKNIVK